MPVDGASDATTTKHSQGSLNIKMRDMEGIRLGWTDSAAKAWGMDNMEGCIIATEAQTEPYELKETIQ
eukprot:scaffold124886_cov29-Prasinocladus_malaysianus.AAC.2